MSDIDLQTLRLPVRLGQRPIQDIAGRVPLLWRGNAARVQIAIFRGEALASLASLAAITFEVDLSQTSALPPLVLVTVPAAEFGSPTLEQWQAGTAQQLEILLSGDQLNLDLCKQAHKDFWLVVHGLTLSGDRVILGVGLLRIEEDNAGNAGTPPPTLPDYYTKAEIDALLLSGPMTHLDLVNPDTGATVRITVRGDHNQLHREDLPE